MGRFLDADRAGLAVVVGRGRFRGKIGLQTFAETKDETYWFDPEAALTLITALSVAHDELVGGSACPAI